MFSRPHLQPARHPGRRTRGFSLIEALIAVVVLSTGLLALAALQSALIRSSVDARIRSSAAAAAMSIFENLRAGSYNNLKAMPDGSAVMATPTYVSVDPAAAGGFTVTINTQDWFDNRAVTPSVFTQGTFNPTSGAPPPLGEFTQVDITVAWTDPSVGGTRSVTFSDIIGPLASFNVNPDTTRLGGGINPAKPIVRTDDPTGPGVIPIAIGEGSESAATNPKPINVGQKDKSSTIETRFNVLNFAPDLDPLFLGQALIQKRVETSVITCICEDGGSPGVAGSIAAAAFRPTFWDGSRYTPPEPTRATAPAAAASGAGIVQSELCNDCCRDHHDPSGVSGPKFDPLRFEASDPHNHFNLVGGALVAANPGGQYLEACRMIRVDGLWRTATDVNNQFFGLLETTTITLQSDNPVPDQDAANTYADFVVEALSKAFVDKTPLDRAGLAGLYDTKLLNAPASIDITRDSADNRWLHARGFYLDHIEQVAQDRIDQALADCPGATPKKDCVFQFVPFNTINLTELATWRESVAGVITVSKGTPKVFGDNPLLPLRGEVTAISNAADNATADAIAKARDSNSGLTVLLSGVDPGDDSQAQEDRQPFRVVTTAAPPGDDFDVIIQGLPQTANNVADDPGVGWQVSSSSGPCAITSPSLIDDVNPYQCNTSKTLGIAAATVSIGGYNLNNPDASRTTTTQVSCRRGNDNFTESKVAPTCPNFEVLSATASSGATGSIVVPIAGEATTGEVTNILFSSPSIQPDDVVTVVFGAQSRTAAVPASCSVQAGTITVDSWKCP